jgi:transcriptional regulator with XRE-family HTH domain
MNLAQRVKQARKNAGFTQQELVKEVNRLTKFETMGAEPGAFTQAQVSDLERGKVNRSSYLPHIAVACRVSAAWLLFGFEPVNADYEVPLAPKADKSLSQEEIDILKTLLKKIS